MAAPIFVAQSLSNTASIKRFNAGSAVPDLTDLGIELKTFLIDSDVANHTQN